MGFFDLGLSDVLGPVAGLIGADMNNSAKAAQQSAQNGFNATQQQLQNDWQTQTNQQAQNFSADQAQKQMDFQQSSLNQQENFASSQSATQYQRAVADMKAAGLNPMLAALKGGNSAATMSNAPGASGQGFAGSSKGASSVGMYNPDNMVEGALRGMSTAADVQLKKTASDKQEAEAKLIEEQTNTQKEEQKLKVAQKAVQDALPAKYAQEINESIQREGVYKAEQKIKELEKAKTISETEANNALTGLRNAQKTQTEDITKGNVPEKTPWIMGKLQQLHSAGQANNPQYNKSYGVGKYLDDLLINK